MPYGPPVGGPTHRYPGGGEEFNKAIALFLSQDNNTNNSLINNEFLREKYPFYKRMMEMSVAVVKDKNELQIAHFSGMATALQVLLLIVEEKDSG